MTTLPHDRSVTPPATATTGERVALATKAALVEQLLSAGVIADFAHPIILGLAVALVWDRMPLPMLIGWAIAVVAATILRAVVRSHSRARSYPPDRALRLTRLTVGAQALAWGVGAAAAAPDLPLPVLALLLVLVTGLVSGAFTTLTPDLASARLFIGGMLLPMAVGVMLNGVDREHVLGVIMIVTYAGFMVLAIQRAHRSLLERHRMHVLLEESEAVAVLERRYMDALLESAPVAICTVLPDGRVGRINRAFERLFGYSTLDAQGRVLDDLIVPPSGRRAAVGYLELAAAGGGVRAEVERMRKDGSTVTVRLSAAHVEGAGEGEVFAVYEDLTQRRRAAETANKLAAIVESSEDAIYSQDLDGIVLSWNAGAERLYGHPADEMVGTSGNVMTPPERLDELRDLHARLAAGQRCPPFETERLRRDGTRVTVSLSASPIRNADGDVIAYSKVARDIATEVAARRALDEARRAAERAAQSRAMFLANMSHEIRTPMNAILGFSELLLESELAPEQRHSLGLVQTSAQTLLTLIDDILDFSKIEADQVQLESIVFDLPHVLETTTSLLSVRARERRIELLADVAGDVAVKVRGDPTRLRQVLTNLIGNAIKFTHEGEVVVAATVAGMEGERQQVRFSVRDTGIGIAADKLDTIFQEFSQADASTTRRYGGTGLGLTIARRLVRLMGGELAVRSELGKGTEFTFMLPLDVEQGQDVALPAGAAHMAGRRTLVVDDNATNRKIVRDMLASASMPITEAESGDAALAILQRASLENEPFDLVILDAQMPGLDGFELAGAVRADPRLAATRLLMLTSAGQRGDGQRCRELGIQGYLAKPASRSDMLEAVAAVLGAPTMPLAPAAVVTKHSIAESRPRLEILLAEDNVVNQEVAATVLRKRGHHVDVVGDGRAATDAIAAKRYDVVLMDIQMPIMDGLEATRAIRATPAGKDLPIIALTAHAQRGEREICLAQGMTDYLTKPFKAHDLFAIIEGRGATAPVADASVPSDSAVDVEGFRREMREAGAEEAVDAILGTFVNTAPGRLRELELAVTSGDPEAVKRAAHAYRSAAATIRARELATLLGEMEDAARGGKVDGMQRIEAARAAHKAALDQLSRTIPAA